MGSDAPKLGQLAPEDAQRDAVHVAIAPAVAVTTVYPGQRVDSTGSPLGTPPVGIVDPFLDRPVHSGERFYIFLFPGTVTAMRHHWSHPSFEDVLRGERGWDGSAIASSNKWLEEFADYMEMSYSELMEHLTEYARSGHQHCLGYDTPDRVYTDREGLFRHFEIVTGIKVKDKEYAPFRCSC